MTKTTARAAACVFLGVLSMITVAEAEIAINADFAGGNVIVQENAGNTVHITPDLRGGKPWRFAGADHVKENTFFYDFAKAGRKVRFAVTIPHGR